MQIGSVVLQEAELLVVMVSLYEILIVNLRLQELLVERQPLHLISVAVLEGQLGSQLLLAELLPVSLLALEVEVVLVQVQPRDEGLVSLLSLALASKLAGFSNRYGNGFNSREVEGLWPLEALEGGPLLAQALARLLVVRPLVGVGAREAHRRLPCRVEGLEVVHL